MTLEKLLEVNNKITGLLGRTINIREHAVKAFRKRIGEYADSHNKKDEIQAWPLVKVCKLRHNWQVSCSGPNALRASTSLLYHLKTEAEDSAFEPTWPCCIHCCQLVRHMSVSIS